MSGATRQYMTDMIGFSKIIRCGLQVPPFPKFEPRNKNNYFQFFQSEYTGSCLTEI